MSEPPSPPPKAAADAGSALAWYKAQYEQLESELSDFRASSQELEAELERDLEAADKRERALKKKNEALTFEVDEWKTKYRQSKTETNHAQNLLEKEITTLRESNRSMQLRLRDIEVANDDYERQARHTTSSLEDMESKYNTTIERAVMLEEEVRMGEQERETMRIDAQRLREELSDLKIEAEILQDKIKKHDDRHLSTISTEISIPGSPTFAHSPVSTASSPLITTPPDTTSESAKDDASEMQDPPPSPPMSEASNTLTKPAVPSKSRPLATRSRFPSSSQNGQAPKTFNHSSASVPNTNANSTPANSNNNGSSNSYYNNSNKATNPPKPSRAATNQTSPGSNRTAGAARGSRTPRAGGGAPHKVPSSTSLSHIRTLTAQMQRLEQRVQSARSKLPAPTNTPPRASPRLNATIPERYTPSMTVRSRKRTTGSTTSSISELGETATTTTTMSMRTPSRQQSYHGGLGSSVSSQGGDSSRNHVPRLSTSGVSKLSFGPLPMRTPGGEPDSRPSSQASGAQSQPQYSIVRPTSRGDFGKDTTSPRPPSRSCMSTPLGVRPRSSMSGSMYSHARAGHSTGGAYSTKTGLDGTEYKTPARRATVSRVVSRTATRQPGDRVISGIPMPRSRRPSADIIGRRTISRSETVDIGETW